MLEIHYEKLVPYPFETVLSQYFDYEHIAHVHPTTLGEYRLVEKSDRRIVYDQIWPAGFLGRRAVSRVVQEYFPPDRTTFEFVAGRYRGTRVDTTLHRRPDGTLVREIYGLPGLPNWKWLRPILKPLTTPTIERVWDEDLRVEVCYGGWPGIPGETAPLPAATGVDPPAGRLDLGPESDFPPCRARRIAAGGAEIAVFTRPDGRRFALGARCSHTGGPLDLGAIEGDRVVCPWHGAAFDLATGAATRGPAVEPVAVRGISVEGGRVLLTEGACAPPA